MIESFKCGTVVTPTLYSIEGMITCIAIRFDKITYEVSYFLNGEQKTMWMNEAEFTTKENKTQIGY